MNEKDSKHFAIIYEALLINIDEYDSLYGVRYIGQSIPRCKQFNTPQDVLNNRKRQHISVSIREDKELGLMAALKKYGEDAFEWKILEHVYLPYVEGQKWANERETYYIEINGGVLKDMHYRFNHTLNHTKGGKRRDRIK